MNAELFPFKIKETEIDAIAYTGILDKWKTFSYFQPFLGATCFVLDYLKKEVVFFAEGPCCYKTDAKEADICLHKFLRLEKKREKEFCHFRLLGVRLIKENNLKNYNKVCFFHFTMIQKEGYVNDLSVIIKSQILLATSEGVPCLSFFTVIENFDRQLHRDSLIDMESAKLYCKVKEDKLISFDIKKFSSEEKEILNFLSQGCSMHHVADSLGLNYYSIRSKVHRLESHFAVGNIRSLLTLLKILKLI